MIANARGRSAPPRVGERVRARALLICCLRSYVGTHAASPTSSRLSPGSRVPSPPLKKDVHCGYFFCLGDVQLLALRTLASTLGSVVAGALVARTDRVGHPSS